MKFVHAVRNDEIPGPTRRKFRLEVWNAEAGRLSEDEHDENLRRAGEWISQRLAAVRTALRFVGTPDVENGTKLRALAAFANHNARALQTKVSEAPPSVRGGDTVFVDDLIGEKLLLPIGTKFTPDEIIQSIVDGVEVPLRNVFQKGELVAGTPNFTKVDWNDVHLDANLGLLYDLLEHVWDDCLWNEYVLSEGATCLLRAARQDYVDWRVVSQYRRDALDMQFLMGVTRWFEAQPLPTQQSFVGMRSVHAVVRDGRRTKYQLTKDIAITDRATTLALTRFYAQEVYYESLLTEEVAAFPGVTLRRLLECWHVVAGVTDLLWERITDEVQQAASEPGNREKPETHMDEMSANAILPRFASPIHEGALHDVVSKALDVQLSTARNLVEFLTYRGLPEQELWAQPLVAVAPRKLVPIFATVRWSNLRRTLDIWMKQLGLDLSNRGAAFEQHVRDELGQYTRESVVLKGAQALDSSFMFRPPDKREEELDVVVVLGNIVLLGEAKCILQPTEPKQYYRHRHTILGAVEQVARKAGAIRDNQAAFIEQANMRGLIVKPGFEVLPLVVLNGPTHAGFAVQGVPIVDLTILRIFFEGELALLATQDKDGAITVLKNHKIYDDWDGATRNARGYFEKPPQLDHLWKGLRDREVPLPAPPNSGLSDAVFLTRETIVDTQELLPC